MITTTVQLPNGILDINGSGEVIREIELRQLDGTDEDMLRDKHTVREGNVLDKLLVRTITRIGGYSDPKDMQKLYSQNMLMADVTFVLVMLRMHSIDHVYSFQFSCPSCGHHWKPTMDLSKLHTDEQPERYAGVLEFPLVVDELVLKCRHLMAKDSKMLEAIKQQYPKEKATRELAMQVLDMNGKRPTISEIKSWSWGFRNRLRIALDGACGGIDTELAIECPRCDHMTKDNMPIELRDFFYPAGGGSSTEITVIPYRDFGTTPSSLDNDFTGALSLSEDSPSKSDSST